MIQLQKFRQTFLRRWKRWRTLAVPSLFFVLVIFYTELFLKLYCFGSVSVQGICFTFLFSLPLALIFGLLCCRPSRHRSKFFLVLCATVYCAWMAAQCVYYHLFKTFMTVFSLTKMGMVAGAFGDMALDEMLLNWFPIVMLMLPVLPAVLFRERLLPHCPPSRRQRRRWLFSALQIQLAAMALVLLCGGGTMSLRYIYTQAAAPELEVQNFGMFTQTQLELRRVLFGIEPSYHSDLPASSSEKAARIDPTAETEVVQSNPQTQYNVMEIDFSSLAAQETDDTLLDMHRYFSQQSPTEKNQWTGYFRDKNLVWIVAEGFCTQVIDPQRTPNLYKLSRSGFVFENFYTPLWGVSTSDGEYVTTTGLIPKSGVWSYSQSSQNYMPFGFGNQFRKLGYTALACHNYLYDYYDRDQSFPNMGYDYRAIGHGLDMELEENFPSDLEMMEKIVPEFIDEERFMVYCLTVSGHLNYNLEENAMCRRHWDEVKDLPYSEAVRCYLACQMELELALGSLLEQLGTAGKLDDTVIVISGDHYPYGLTDEQYSELLGHEVDPVFEIYENSLILWSAGMEQRVVVDKYCSSLDVMPTLANLFGLEYDSRLMAGRDILSDAPGLVIFSNYSFIDEVGRYDSTTDTFTCWDGSEADGEYTAAQMAEVQNRVAYSAAILDQDYYRIVLDGPAKEE